MAEHSREMAMRVSCREQERLMAIAEELWNQFGEEAFKRQMKGRFDELVDQELIVAFKEYVTSHCTEEEERTYADERTRWADVVADVLQLDAGTRSRLRRGE